MAAKKAYLVHAPSARGPLQGMLVVLWHGAGGDIDQAHLVSLARALPAAGAHVVRARFPYRAEGRRAPDRMPKLVEAGRELTDRLKDELRPKKVVLGGRSMGGRMTTMLAAEGYPVDGLVLLSYPLHPAGKPQQLRAAHLPNVQAPLLFVQGNRDALCDLDLLSPVMAQLGKRAKLHVVDKADHSFRRVPEAEVDAVVLGFLEKL